MRVVLIVAALILSAGLLAAQTSAASAHETGFLNRRLVLAGNEYKYQVYLPAEWTPQKKWPVILFLHGYGESGDDGMASTDVGLGSAIRQNPARFPFVIVFPQCPWQHWWSDDDMARMALAALETAVREFNGDTNRLYLTGLSMGGYGSWYIASHFPAKFAAVAPVCGGLRASWDPQRNREPNAYDKTALAIGKTPVWIFHGGADDTVPVEESRAMFQALKRAGAAVRYYEYAGVGHNSWDKAYAEPEVPAWLLSKRLADPAKGKSQAEVKVIPQRPTPVAVDPKVYADFVGSYERQLSPGVMNHETIAVENGTLVGQFMTWPKVTLLPLSDHEFFADDNDERVYVFQRDPNGRVDTLILRGKRHDDLFRRVR